ncbi:MAG: hypothetical protein ACE5FU_13285, partial [Nitrospinota bacterium]
SEKIVQIGESVSAIASQVGGLDSQINGFQESLSRYEKSILSLELKKSLVTVDEVISKSNDRTLDAAIRTKAALRSLIDLITASSAGSRYRVKQISQGNEETLPTVSTIKAGPKEQGKENSEG